jgi:hypothetical protein
MRSLWTNVFAIDKAVHAWYSTKTACLAHHQEHKMHYGRLTRRSNWMKRTCTITTLVVLLSKLCIEHSMLVLTPHPRLCISSTRISSETHRRKRIRNTQQCLDLEAESHQRERPQLECYNKSDTLASLIKKKQ